MEPIAFFFSFLHLKNEKPNQAKPQNNQGRRWHSHRLFTLLFFWFPYILLTQAQRIKSPDHDSDGSARPLEPASPQWRDSSERPRKKPALLARSPSGMSPYMAPEDEETDMTDMAKKTAGPDLRPPLILWMPSWALPPRPTRAVSRHVVHDDGDGDDPNGRLPGTGIRGARARANHYFALCFLLACQLRPRCPPPARPGCLCNERVRRTPTFNAQMRGCYRYLAAQNRSRSQFGMYVTAVSRMGQRFVRRRMWLCRRRRRRRRRRRGLSRGRRDRFSTSAPSTGGCRCLV